MYCSKPLKFLDKTFNNDDVYDPFRHVRNYFVHPVVDQGVPASFYNLDQIEVMEEMECFADLIERLATKILDAQLDIMSKQDPDIKALLTI